MVSVLHSDPGILAKKLCLVLPILLLKVKQAFAATTTKKIIAYN